MGDAVVEQKEFNAQLSEKIHTEENSLDQRLDGLNNDFEHEWDNLQDSIEDLTDQHQCPPEEECQSGTMVEEPCLQQPQESLVENFESSVGAAICLWEKKEATFSLTEKSGGHETEEEPQEPILQPIPMNLNPSATAQLQNSPLPVYILPPTCSKIQACNTCSQNSCQPITSCAILQEVSGLCTDFFHYLKEDGSCTYRMA